MSGRKILLVDDRIKSLKGLAGILEDEGYQVLEAGSGEKALRLFQGEGDVDLVLADLKMPGMDGVELFRRMKSLGPAPPFIIMTAYGDVRSAVNALKEGVSDYLIKPLDYEELNIILAKAVREREMYQELIRLRKQAGSEAGFHGLVGVSRRMKEIFAMVERVGPTDASVLISGETGTGKELLAAALHAESPRRDKSLVCINCAALTESLLEAELFGHVKGSFTGAVSDRIGRLEKADGGTLFLDEIGHMSLPLQAKLLRFLQDRKFEPVGGTVSRQVDVRLISASNMALQDKIKAGEFLSDLLYRIEVINLHLPPLRERREDLPLLVDHFRRIYSRQYGKNISGLDAGAMAALLDYDWPGNVRELENVLARAIILSMDETITVHDLPARFQTSEGSNEKGRGLIQGLPESGIRLQDMERELIRLTLLECEGNKSRAAKWLGISRKALYQKIERLGLDEPED